MSDLGRALIASLDAEDVEVLADLLRPGLAPEPASDRWLDVGEAADHLRCPKSRIYSLVSAKRIPHEKDGSRLLFSRGDLDRWVRAGGGIRP